MSFDCIGRPATPATMTGHRANPEWMFLSVHYHLVNFEVGSLPCNALPREVGKMLALW